jgi:hypothetical protein
MFQENTMKAVDNEDYSTNSAKPSAPTTQDSLRAHSLPTFITMKITSLKDVETFVHREEGFSDRFFKPVDCAQRLCEFENATEFLNASRDQYWDLLNNRHSSNTIHRLTLPSSTDSQSEMIIKKISQTTCIDEVDLGGIMIQISPEHAFQLGESLKQAAIRQIILGDQLNNCSDEALEALFKGLANSHSLASLNCRGTLLDSEKKMTQLTNLLTTLPNLRVLDLQDCQIKLHLFQSLAQCLGTMNHLVWLDLIGNSDIPLTEILELSKNMKSLSFLGSDTAQRSQFYFRKNADTYIGSRGEKVFFYNNTPDEWPLDSEVRSILYPYQYQPAKATEPHQETKAHSGFCTLL